MLSYGYEPLNPSLEATLLYIQFLANSFSNIKSVKNYLSGAKTFLLSHGKPSTNLNSPLVATLLKGASNLSAHQEHQAPPLPRTMLLRLCNGLRLGGPDGEVTAAAVLFGVANFLVTPGGDGRHQISRAEVTEDAAGLRVQVRSTKTLSPRSGGVVLPVAWVPGFPYCPVKVREGRWAADFPKLCVFVNRSAISEHKQTYCTSN